MEKENRIPPSRHRRAGTDGPAPTALATPAEPASGADPAGGGAEPGQEEGAAGGRPGAGPGGTGRGDAGRGPDVAHDQPGASGLPHRVRGMGDGPRPPARVARPPVLPASFLERVRAAAEAERRMEQLAGEQAGPSPEPQPESRPEPPAARPEGPARPPRFVRSRDWMARAGEKKDRGRGDQPGLARDVVSKGGPGPAEPGPPPLPRRKMGASHPPRPVPQAQPDAAGVPAARKPSDALTEPIPVIRVPRPGEPPRPGQPPWEDPAGGVAAQEARPAEQAAAREAPVAQAAAREAPVAQAAAQPSAAAGAAEQAASRRAAAQAPARPSEQAAGRPARTGDARRAGWAAAGQAAVEQAGAEQAGADQAAADRAAAQAAAAQAAARRAADEAAVQRAARLLARPPSALNRRLVGLAAGSSSSSAG